MKKLLLFVVAFLFVSSAFAYTPTSQDTVNLTNLKWQLDNLVENNNVNLWDFQNQLRKLEVQYASDDRLKYMLSNIKDYLYTKLYSFKNAAKVSSKTTKQNFLDQYKTGFSVQISGSLDNCIGWYNTLDDISFAYNFPTPLTIAAWYRESTCAYYLPSNWDGPFQIVAKDYGTWQITQDVFIDSVVDFMEFTRGKFDRYLTQLTWSLTYTGYDMTWISNFAALYNGWTKSGNIIVPNRTDYLLDWYGQDFSGATRYGIFPQFIKALERELAN